MSSFIGKPVQRSLALSTKNSDKADKNSLDIP